MRERLSGSNEDLHDGESTSDPAAGKKLYVSPRLVMLGQVIELTQGGGSVAEDGVGTFEGNI